MKLIQAQFIPLLFIKFIRSTCLTLYVGQDCYQKNVVNIYRLFCQFSICRFLSTISMIIMQTFLTTAKYYKITSRSGLIFVIDYTRIISRIIFNITYNDKMGRRWTKTALLAATLVVMVLVCTCLRMYKRGRLCLQIPMGIKPTRNLPTHFENRHPRYTLEALHESADVGSNNNNCCLSFC